MADFPAPIFRPMQGRRSNFFNQQPLRSGISGSIEPTQQGFIDASETVAVYQFEGTAFLTHDSIGSNTLTNVSTAIENASDTKEASFSIQFDGSNYMTIPDANQDARFPLKNGASNTIFSVTTWFKLDSATGPQVLWSKGDGSNKSVQFAVLASGNFGYRVHTGVVFEDIDFGVAASSGEWYHVGLQADHDAMSYQMTLFNATTSSETLSTQVGTIAVPTPTAPWSIGAEGDGSDGMAGLMDEFTITDRLLGIPDIRQIREGIYDGPLSNRITSFGVQTLNITSEKPIRLTQFGLQVLVGPASGIMRATQFGVQVLHLGVPSAVKIFPLIPTERVYESQTGKRIFPLP